MKNCGIKVQTLALNRTLHNDNAIFSQGSRCVLTFCCYITNTNRLFYCHFAASYFRIRNTLYVRIVLYIALNKIYTLKQTLSKENPHRILSFGHNNPALKTMPIRGRLFKGGFNFNSANLVLKFNVLFSFVYFCTYIYFKTSEK